MFKKFVAIVIICTLLMTVCASPLSAIEPRVIYHYKPHTTEKCYGIMNTTHTRYVGVYNGAHQLEDGTVCYYTAVRWEHTSVCPKCKYQTISTYDCQVEHTVCGESVSCPYSY